MVINSLAQFNDALIDGGLRVWLLHEDTMPQLSAFVPQNSLNWQYK
jgi:hypothetical protein